MFKTGSLMLTLTLGGCAVSAQGSGTTITPIRSETLAGYPNREIAMITVEYAPGAADPVHTHHAQAMVYVLEGSVVMQVKGKAPVTLRAGESFYEAPDDVHVVAKNASQSASARFVVFFVKNKSEPILVPVE